MLNNLTLILISLLLLLSCNSSVKEKCSKEEINRREKQLQLAFQEWKSSLNYMDAEIIFPAKLKVDSLFSNLQTCIPSEDSIVLLADSISHIYADLNIEKFEIEKGEKLLRSLAKKIELK